MLHTAGCLNPSQIKLKKMQKNYESKIHIRLHVLLVNNVKLLQKWMENNKFQVDSNWRTEINSTWIILKCCNEFQAPNFEKVNPTYNRIVYQHTAL